MRRTSTSVASQRDGETKNIANHFSFIYSKLYTEKVENLITPDKITDVEAVTANIIKKDAQKLKLEKSDPSFSFLSDCIKNGPEVLYAVLARIYQGFMIHARN